MDGLSWEIGLDWRLRRTDIAGWKLTCLSWKYERLRMEKNRVH